MDSIIDYKIIGDRIKKRRIELNMTQQTLAELASMSVFYISKIENSKSSPTLETLAILAHALNTDLAYLINGTSKLDHTYIDKRLEDIQKKANDKQLDLIIKISKAILEE